MSWYDGRRVLEDGDETLTVPVPVEGSDYEGFLRITGTFSGTIQVQDQDGNSLDVVEAGATGTVSAADPTAAGVYHFAPASDDTQVQVTFSAYTSGSADVQVGLLPTA